MARWLNLRTAFFLCLAVEGLSLAGWLGLDRGWDATSPSGRVILILKLVIVLFSALAITTGSLLLRRRAAAASNLESKFRSLLDATPDPIAIMNGDGVVCLVNARAEQLFQASRADLIGKSINYLLFQSERGVDIENSLADYRNSESSHDGAQTHDLKARRSDGTWVPVEISFSPLETKEGTLTISILRDISERKRSEHLRDIRHAVRRQLAEGGPQDGAVPRCLETVCRALGLKVAALWSRGQPEAPLRCAVATDGLTAGAGIALQEAARSGAPVPGEGAAGRALAESSPAWSDPADAASDGLHAAAGRQGLRSAFAFPILFDAEVLGVVECFGGEAPRRDDGLIETLSSVGAQLGRFLKHQQAEEAVHLSEARKTAILESALDAIITVDPDGGVLEFNPAAERLFGYTRAAVAGRPLADLIVPEASRAAYGRRMSSCRRRDGAAAGERSEMSLRRADGSAVPVELVVSPIRVEGPPLFTFYIRDLTERVRAEESLKRTEEQFRQAQKMEAVGRLAGGVAHDFNNLLTVINGYAQSLLNKLPAGDKSRAPIELIHKAGNKAATLTRQLLAFSRCQVMEPKVFCLNAVVTETSKMLQRLIGEDVSLEVLPAPDLKRVKADQGRIEQVLMNLAVNARDAMPDGGKLVIETRNVTLDETYARTHSEVRPGRYVLLAVTDTGVGMDEKTQARIFEPFFTTKEVGKGTGLGLATVYGIVKQSEGHVAVYSEVNRGTTFKVYLPVSDAKESPAAVGLARLSLPPSGKGTVLLVEDEDMVRTLSCQILQEQGYTVLQARHGAEALEISDTQLKEVKLTVTDVVMPGMDGRALAQRLLVRKPDMKVLYVSGYAEKAIVHNGMLEADTVFLEKPFSPEGLARKVHEMMTA